VSALADINVHRVAGAFSSIFVFARAIIPQTCIGQFRKINRVSANFKFIVGEQLDAELKRIMDKLVFRFTRVLNTWIIITCFYKMKS